MNPSMLPLAVLSGIETGINGALRLDPETMARVRGLQGRVIGVTIRLGEPSEAESEAGLKFFVVPTAAGLRLMDRFEGAVDTEISGYPLSLLRLLSGDARAEAFGGAVEIRGDTELGQRFRQVLVSIDIDWEEHLSRFTGDILAHQAGNIARGLGQWADRAMNSLRADAADYLREEHALVPRRYEIDDWMMNVDKARDDVERLAARIERIGRPRR